MAQLTKPTCVREARRTRIDTQWGRMTLYDWLEREAERLTAAGQPARRVIFDGSVCICTVEVYRRTQNDRMWRRGHGTVGSRS